MLVEDEAIIRRLLTLFLVRNKKHAFTVYSAENGEEGVKLYDKLVSEGNKPDLVLMDLRMPVMDGVEATRRIIEHDPRAKIYLFTAYTGTEMERDALNAGAKGAVSKDADWHRLVDNILDILESF